MSNPISLFPAINSVYISDPNGLPVLGQSPYGTYGIQDWMYAANYQSKVCFDDPLNFTAHIQGTIGGLQSSGANLYLCDYYDPNTGDYKLYGATAYNTIAGGSVNLNIAPFFKGSQQIPGNNYINPLSADNGTPLKSFMWAFSFTDLGISTEDTYYLLFINSLNKVVIPPVTVDTIAFSEPIQVRASWPDTLLFQSQFATNKSGRKNVVVTGWFNDYPANTQTYTPIFCNRCEGYVIDDDPNVILAGYPQQMWNTIQTYSEQVRTKTLAIGELSIGIPPHMLEAITAQVQADTFYINTYPYILPINSTSTQKSKLWKSRRPNAAYPLFYAGTALEEVNAGQMAIVTPPPPIPTRYFSPADFSDGFA